MLKRLIPRPAVLRYIQTRMRVSIHVAVIAFFLFATIITATIAISMQYIFSRNLAAETTLISLENAAASTQKYLKEVDERASASARIMSQYIGFDDNNRLDRRSRIMFTEVMKDNPLFHAMYIGFENGNYFGIVNLDADKQSRTALQAQRLDRWVIVKITGNNGNRKRSMDFVDSDFKIRTTRVIETDFKANYRPWFVDASKGKVHKTAPYLFQHLQVPGETYSIKLPSNEAVLGIDITTATTSEYLTELTSSLDSEMYLFGERGELVATNQLQLPQVELPPSPELVLTEAQKRLVKNTPYLRVSNETDWPPISFAASGKPYGYAIDVLKYISSMTGIELRYVNGLQWSRLSKMFADNELDMLQPVYYTPARALVGNISDSFLNVPYGVLTVKNGPKISHIDQLKGKKVAVPEGWLLAHHLEEQFPTIKIVRVANVRAMFDAVREGEVDAAMDTALILHYTAQQFFIDDVVVNTPLELGGLSWPENLHFMLSKDEPELTELINQALAKLGPDYHKALQDKWFLIEDEHRYSLGTLPYKNLMRLAQQGGTNGLVTVGLRGVDYYAYVTSFEDNNDRKDFFAIVTPVSGALAAGNAKVVDSIIITSVVLLLLLPLAWLLAGPFANPIHQLAMDSKNIAHRRYDSVGRVDSTIAEVHDLAISMESMLSSIQEHEQAQEKLLDAFIKVIAQAIDDKSPHTAGHCERVPELAFMLIEKASKTNVGVFETFSFETADQWREFEVAAWLHDCGKITTPEHIIDKGTKLEANYNRIHEIRMRFEVLWRDAEIDYLMQCSEQGNDKQTLLAEKHSRQQQLHDDFAFIANANIGGEFMSDEDIDRLQQLAKITWQRHFAQHLGLSHIEQARYPSADEVMPATESLLADKPYHIIERTRATDFDPEFGIKMDIPENLYNMGELHNLSVKRGTLADEDRFKINEHIISTIKMLENLPFPTELSNVPRYASTHHETMKGTGYPRKLSADDLSIPERIMVLADIFEALTAADRPYKKAKTISEALAILHKMVLDEHVDVEVFELFLSSGVHVDYAKRFLAEEQLDEVDISQYFRAV